MTTPTPILNASIATCSYNDTEHELLLCPHIILLMVTGDVYQIMCTTVKTKLSYIILKQFVSVSYCATVFLQLMCGILALMWDYRLILYG